MLDTKLPWKLDHHRYAILGVPRSGTQLLESFIKYSLSKNHDNVVAMQEIFSIQAVLVNSLTLEDKFIKVHDHSNVAFYDMMKASKERLEIIKNADANQSMVCRVFLDDRMGSLGFIDGVKYLQSLNFNFVYINRKFDHKILSGVFAKESFIFNRIKNNMTLTINIDDLKSNIIARHLIEQHHYKLMQKLIPEYHVVEYDSLVEKANELSSEEWQEAFGIYKEKQLPLDPYEQIENRDEVKQVFEEFYPKLQTLTATLLD
jgi:hypothetical protein